jgi:hypothetical protein
MGLAGHVAHVGDEKCIQNLVRRSEGKNYLEDLGVDGRGLWTGFIWLRIGINGGLL